MTTKKIPAVFVTDYGPMPALQEDDYTAALGRLGQTLSRPQAIIVMSGHWDGEGTLALTASPKPGVMHDYSGFPAEYYRVDYPCPGDPALARAAVDLLAKAGLPAKLDFERPLDHGAWVPLSRLYPKADIPVVQLSVPAGEDPRKIFKTGQALAPLRESGVLLLGAGTLIHNLRIGMSRLKNAPIEPWAREFDAWFMEKLNKGDVESIFNYRSLSASAKLAAPTTEHFDPLFFVMGAAADDAPRQLYSEFQYGIAAMKIIAFGT